MPASCALATAALLCETRVMRMFTLCFIAAAALPVGLAAATVQVGASGFAIKHEVTVQAPPARVYATLVREVGRWWDPEHTYSGDSGNLSIEARPGGCFCEALPAGGGVEHLRVVYVEPGSVVRLSGALGPLQAAGLAGSMTWTLGAAAEGTTVQWRYVVGGFMEGDFEKIAPAVDAMLGEQIGRLKRFVETGKP
jgi:uncharacterized protein YndB with AHSA1/START domain